MIRADAPFVIFDEIDSTNEEARRRAAGSDLQPAWLLAKQQTAGRGRRGRSWTTLPGNMFLTYYGVTERPPADIALLGFAAGVALAESCAPFVGQDTARLKWPNDLLLDGRKAAGILLESAQIAPGTDNRFWFALGVGLNIAGAPDDAGQPTGALKEFTKGEAPSPISIAQTFAVRAAHWGATFEQQGFEPLRAAWEARARGLGGVVSVDIAGTRIEGRAQGLSLRGELILILPSGETRLISAGDVYFPASAAV
jgi:BirA family transcriptional regulator, biotin operon repressor / biotin---[acetyl-CoA-carboxylase] ligase